MPIWTIAACSLRTEHAPNESNEVMQRLVIATTATEFPMGAQVYEEEIAARAATALASLDSPLAVERLIARSVRSPLPGSVRLPVGRLERAGTRERRTWGRLVYPRGTLVHRMGLTLPPASHEIVTMHDTVAWRFPDEGSPPACTRDELQRASAIVAVSHNTAAELVEMFSVPPPDVVYSGVDDRFRAARPLAADERERFGVPERYVLHSGGASTRKNLEGLAAAWPQVRHEHPDVGLVMTGPPHARRDSLFADLPGVTRLGRVTQALVPTLMAGAEAVVVPSLYEGFGLPVLEAMAAGAPVVVARTSALVEAAGDAGILVEPDGNSIAAGLDAVLSGRLDRGSIVAAGRRHAAPFTWERAAKQHAAVWERVRNQIGSKGS